MSLEVTKSHFEYLQQSLSNLVQTILNTRLVGRSQRTPGFSNIWSEYCGTGTRFSTRTSVSSSRSFHQCSTIFSILIQHRSEGNGGEVCKPSKKSTLLLIQGSIRQNSSDTFCNPQRNYSMTRRSLKQIHRHTALPSELNFIHLIRQLFTVFIDHAGPQGEQRYSSTPFQELRHQIGVEVSPTPRPPVSTGKTRYPFYKRLGGPQDPSGRAEILVPTEIRSRTVQPVVSRYTD